MTSSKFCANNRFCLLPLAYKYEYFSTDDLLTLARNYRECERNIKHKVVLLDSLVFIVHPEEPIFTPVQSLKYLVFISDSQIILVSLTDDKKL